MKPVITFVLAVGLGVLGMNVIAQDLTPESTESMSKSMSIYPNVWSRHFNGYDRVEGLIVLSDEAKKPFEANKNYPEVLMKVRNKNVVNLVSFFSGKKYAGSFNYLDQKAKLTNYVGYLSASRVTLNDGTVIETVSPYDGLDYENSWCKGAEASRYYCVSLTSTAIGKYSPLAEEEILNGKTEETVYRGHPYQWLKLVVSKTQKRKHKDMQCNDETSVDSEVIGLIDLHDGTVIVYGSTFVIRLLVADGSFPENNRKIRVMDFQYAKELVNYHYGRAFCGLEDWKFLNRKIERDAFDGVIH